MHHSGPRERTLLKDVHLTAYLDPRVIDFRHTLRLETFEVCHFHGSVGFLTRSVYPVDEAVGFRVSPT